jgi:uncharacterized protein YqeY
MDLREQLLADMNQALKSGDKIALGAIRLLRVQIHEEEKQKKRPLTDEEIAEIGFQAIRKRRDAIEQFQRGNRQDLVDKEETEIKVVERYLPARMGEAELRGLVTEAIRETGATQPKDLGKVMGRLMPKVKGKADGGEVNRIVRELLAAAGGSGGA